MKKITVRLGIRSYPIFVGARLKGLGAYLAGRDFSHRVLVITNPTVKKLYFKSLSAGLAKAGFEVSCAVMPDGERYKTFNTVDKLYAAACAAKLDRCSPVIALGGGVVGDVAGFVAATYLRGVPLIQVPTTLLAMVDSSVGGKTGFDLAEGKNLVGAFYQPKVVWIDTATLHTLPLRQLRNGLAEVIKYGVIKEKSFFRFLAGVLEKKITPGVFERIVHRCCSLKADVVEQDEFEQKGVREILNFGHTFGHALETVTGYKRFLHGEAVGIGMVYAGKLAVHLGLFSQKEQGEAVGLIAAAGLPTEIPKGIPAAKILAAMKRDKKTRSGKLRFVLPRKIGKVFVYSSLPDHLITEVLQ